MEGIISSILSILGLGQHHSQAVSARRNEASKLNAEFELMLNKTAEMLRSEQVHLMHRIQALCEDPSDSAHLQTQVDTIIEQLLAEIQTGRNTASNSYERISNASSFASLRQWDEVIAILQRHLAASKLQWERSDRCIGQFHRILDNAESSLSHLDEVELSFGEIDVE